MDRATADLLHQLEPAAERLLERHLASAKEWFPHELVPWSRGRDFEPDEDWDPAETDLSDAARSALYVNLLTEDNLPHYFRTISSMFELDAPWGSWSRRWTAEEGRHSIVIRDYLTVTRSIDPWVLERSRMAQVSGGEVPEPPTVPELLVYVALQELATRISHRNTGRVLDDRKGYEIMARVAGDENLHHNFYRDMTAALIEVDPSAAVLAIEAQVRQFEMPGTGIPEFAMHAKRIADAGIYDFISHHDLILKPIVLGTWGLGSIEGLTPEAERARDRTVTHIEKLGRVARRLADRREARKAAEVESGPADQPVLETLRRDELAEGADAEAASAGEAARP